MNVTSTFPSTDTLRIEELEAEIATLTGYRETQAIVIKGYQVRVVAAEKRVEKLQDMNDHAQSHIARLEAQRTDEARAERQFK